MPQNKVRGKIGFDFWMVLVDRAVTQISALSVGDLPDCCFADWYDDGMSPRTAARKAIRAAGAEW